LRWIEFMITDRWREKMIEPGR